MVVRSKAVQASFSIIYLTTGIPPWSLWLAVDIRIVIVCANWYILYLSYRFVR